MKPTSFFSIILILSIRCAVIPALASEPATTPKDSARGVICITPTFHLDFIGHEVVELTMIAGQKDGDFEVWIEGHPIAEDSYVQFRSSGSFSSDEQSSNLPCFGHFQISKVTGNNPALSSEALSYDSLPLTVNLRPRQIEFLSGRGQKISTTSLFASLCPSDVYHTLKLYLSNDSLNLGDSASIAVEDSQFIINGQKYGTQERLLLVAVKTAKGTKGQLDKTNNLLPIDRARVSGERDSVPTRFSIRDAHRLVPSTAIETVHVRNGVGKEFYRLSNFLLYRSEGYVVVRYRALQKACPEWDEGTEIVSVLENKSLSVNAGLLFGLGVSGSVKGYPEVSLDAQTEYLSLLTGFTELRYTSIAALESVKTSNKDSAFFNPFQAGGGVFNADVGFLIHPWDKEYQTSALSVLLGAGFRTFAQSGISKVFDRPRAFAGVHFDIPAFNLHNSADKLNHPSGYFEVGYSYDEFWRVDSANQRLFYQPRRIFFEGQIELTPGGAGNIPLQFYLEGDIPIEHFTGGLMELNFGITAGIDGKKISDFLTSIVNIF